MNSFSFIALVEKKTNVVSPARLDAPLQAPLRRDILEFLPVTPTRGAGCV